MNQSFKILGEIEDFETIASGNGVVIRRHLDRIHGKGRWRKMKGFATVELENGTILKGRRSIGLRPTASVVKNLKSNVQSMSDFVICLGNDANPASLIVGKVYRCLPDSEAQSHQMLRILDEDTSELDGYLYPASNFAPVELPDEAKQVLMSK